ICSRKTKANFTGWQLKAHLKIIQCALLVVLFITIMKRADYMCRPLLASVISGVLANQPMLSAKILNLYLIAWIFAFFRLLKINYIRAVSIFPTIKFSRCLKRGWQEIRMFQ